MTVDSFSDKLSAYIDGELTEADRIEMEKMISEIPSCAAMYKNMVLLQERLGNLSKLQPSAEFEFGLRSQILLEAANETRMRHKVKQTLFPSVGRSVLSGAVAAMLVLGVSVVFQGDPNEEASISQAATPAPVVATETNTHLGPVQSYVATNQLPKTVPTQPVDRGALKQLSQEESFALSRRLYRSDSPSSHLPQPRTRPVAQQGQARRVPVSF